MSSEPNGWLSKNALRAYPFKEDTSKTYLLSGLPGIVLEDNVVLDLVISTGRDLTTLGSIAITSMLWSSTEITFLISEDGVDIASAILDPAVFAPLATIPLTPIRSDTAGVIVFGEGLETLILASTLGVYAIEAGGGILEERAIKNNPYARVTSISEFTDPGTSVVGDVKLEEGYNIELTRQDSTNAIRLSAVVGAGKGIFCGGPCPEPEICKDVVYTINGISPNDAGNFSLSGDNYVTVTEGTNRVVLGTAIDPLNLCERPGTTGIAGPTGASGPAGAGGTNAPLDCAPCIDCANDCTKPLTIAAGGGPRLGDVTITGP